MNTAFIAVAAGAAAGAAAFIVGLAQSRRYCAGRLAEARALTEKMIADAQRTADSARRDGELEARKAMLELKMEFEIERKARRDEIKVDEDMVRSRDADIGRRVEVLERTETALIERSRAIDAKQRVLDERLGEAGRLISEQNGRLEKIAGLRKEDAKQLLMKNLEDEARMEAARRGREIRSEQEKNAERDARKVIATAIQRFAAEQSVETTVSVVQLPSDDMKGRIIGREGRNIRAFEMAAGVDLIIDDTPEAVVISSFDPVRREVARSALQRLVEDGRIHPGRIEEVLQLVRGEIEQTIVQAGEQACIDLGIQGLDRELIEHVGRMRYRTSYGQNCLAHSMEVAYLAGIMAAEINLDTQTARRAGLLHDIGKVVSHEVEGSHTEIGAELARRHGESDEVVNAIRAHHGDVEATSLYTPLVGAADAISGARPGARRESLESYVKRLAKLEEIADGFDGVEKSYAIQAGREIRIMVSNRKIDDDGAAALAYNVSRKLEKEIDYPGQIKVVVIRETRAVQYAK